MNIRRKVAAIAGSAMLLSSLIAVVAAPSAFAAVSVTSAGNVAAGATSASTTVISFTENSAACFNAAGNSPALLVTITDSAGANTVHFSGTPVPTAQGNPALPAPGSLGASASLQSAGATNNQLRINFAASDTATVERFDVTGLKISADAGAATGGVIATVSGPETNCVMSATATATGLVQGTGPTNVGVLAGDTVGLFTVTSVCGFRQSTGGGPGLDANALKLTFNDGVLAESRDLTAVSPVILFGTSAIGATQTLTFATPVTNGHPANTPVSQTVSRCTNTIGSPANVVNGASQASTVTQVGNNPVTVNPGEQNQPAGSTTLSENRVGAIQPGSLTFALSQPPTGSVQFSTSPTVVTTTPGPIASPVVTATANPGPGSCAAATYFYKVTSTTAAGETTPSASATATTTTGGSSVTVTWTAVAGATGYKVYGRPATVGGVYGLIATNAGNANTTFTDLCTVVPGAVPPLANTAAITPPSGVAVVPNTSGGTLGPGICAYAVTALTAAGETTISPPAGITVLFSTSTSSATITWTADPGAIGYKVYRAANTGCTAPAGTSFSPAGSATSFTDDGIVVFTASPVPATNTATIPPPSNVTATASSAPGTLPLGTYCYRVTAANAGGQTGSTGGTSASGDDSVACATLLTTGSISVSWGAVTGATSYNVYGRPTTPVGVFGLIANTTGTSYTDASATPTGAAPPAADTGTGGVAPTVGTVCNLSPDRKSCTVAVGAAGTVQPSTVTLKNILLDVSPCGSTSFPCNTPGTSSDPATLGFAVNITITGSPALIVIVNSQTIAYIARVIVGIADQPTIYINYNDQITGTIKLVESMPGFFNAGIGGNNAVGLCLITGETFTRAPYIIVTSGDVKLNDGAGNPVSQVKGVQYIDSAGHSCVRWTIYSASTVASTIEIRGSDATGAILPAGLDSGPRLSVGPGLRPGTTQGVVLVGSQANVLVGALTPPSTSPAFSKLVSMATRAYKSGVTVSVVGTPPFIAPGTEGLAANISIKESLNGQLKAGDLIVVQLLPRSTRLRNDVLMNTGSTNQLPIVTTNAASGLLVSPVTFPGAPIVNCQPAIAQPLLSVCAFAFTITQQAFGPTLGEITISNMDYIVAPDAALGPVQVNVFSFPAGNVGQGGGVLFNQVVTNAIIGTAPTVLPPALTKTSASSAITKTQAAGAFSVSTKIYHLGSNAGCPLNVGTPTRCNPNNVVTIRIKVDPALVGKTVQIQRATRSASGVWSAFTTITGRVIGADGYAYYYASAHSPQWLSFRGAFAGNAQFAASHSQTVQVRWL